MSHKARIYSMGDRMLPEDQRRPIEDLQRFWPEHASNYRQLRKNEAAWVRAGVPFPDYEGANPPEKVNRYTESSE